MMMFGMLCASDRIMKAVSRSWPRYAAQSGTEVEAESRVAARLTQAALEPKVFADYLATAGDFVSFMQARGHRAIPISDRAVIAFLYSKFARGHTARTAHGTLTKIKYFYTKVLNEEWLSQFQKSNVNDAIRAMGKYDFTVTKKALPLYLDIIILLYRHARATPADRLVYASWVLAYQAMARFGEVINEEVRAQHLEIRRDFLVFYHKKPPKAHKTLPAPYAVRSRRQSPFQYKILLEFMQEFHPRARSVASQKRRLFPAVSGAMVSMNPSATLTKAEAIKRLRRWLAQAGVPQPNRYAGHSPRRGAYNDSLARSVPTKYVHAQGHWLGSSDTASLEYSVAALWARLKYY